MNKFKSIFISTLLTVIVYISYNTFPANHNKRNLLIESDYTSLCLNNNNTSIVGNNLFLSVNSTLQTYLGNFSFIKNDQSQNIQTIITSQDPVARQDAAKSLILNVLAPFIVFIIFAVLTIIFWITYIGCCCCPSCCCKNITGEEPACGCQRFSLLALVVIAVGVIIVCIIGFIFSSSAYNNLTSVDCSLYRFYLDFKSGQLTNSTPRWIGLEGINYKLGNFSAVLDTVSQNSQNAFKDTSNTQTEYNNYQNMLISSYDNYKTKTTSNPNPFTTSTTPYSPQFIQAYGPMSNSGSTVGSLNVEFNSTLVTAANYLQSLKGNVNQINSNINSLKNIINSAISTVSSLDSNFTSIDTNYISKYKTFKSDYSSQLNKSFIGLFVVLLGVDLLFLLFLLLLGCFNLSLFKYFSHVIWYLIMLITIINFILAAAFGTIGTVSYYVGPVFNAIFSPQELPNLFTNSNEQNLINTCINGNGDTRQFIFGNSSIVDTVNTYYSYSYKLSLIEASLKQYGITSSKVISFYLGLYNEIISDIGVDAYTGNITSDSPLRVLQDFSSFTDASYPNSKQAQCSNYVYDFWYSRFNSCPNSYTTVTYNGSTSINIGKSSCMKVREWNSTLLQERYVTQPSCPTSVDYINKVTAYSNSLNQYAMDAQTLLKGLINDLGSFNSTYSNTSKNIESAIQQAGVIINPILNLLNDTIGQNDFFSMVNCHFVSDDAAVAIYAFHTLGVNFIQISACLAALSFLNLLLVMFGVIYLLRRITREKVLEGRKLVDVESGMDSKALKQQ